MRKRFVCWSFTKVLSVGARHRRHLSPSLRYVRCVSTRPEKNTSEPTPPHPSGCGDCPPAPADDGAAAFSRLYGGLFSSIDITPVKRPRLMGSLACSLEGYPVTIVLVDGCEGMTSDEVTLQVQRHAVRLARSVQAGKPFSFRAFLLDSVCRSHRTVMALLDDLDLQLQLRLVMQDTQVSRSGGSATEATTWQCAAAVYDAWDEAARFLPLTEAVSSSPGEGAEETIAAVMAHVERELTARHAALVQGGVEEAQRYIQEAGHGPCETALTAALKCAAARSHASIHQLSAGALTSRQSGATWLLRCRYWTRRSSRNMLGLQICLDHVAELSCSSAAVKGNRCVLASSVVNRLSVPGLVCDPALALSDDCLYANLGTSTEQHCMALSVAELESGLRSGDVTLVAACCSVGPPDVSRRLVECAAVLAPAIAHDWLGTDRGLELPGSGAGCAAAEGCGEPTAGAPATVFLSVPDCVRWTSYAGLTVLNGFLAASAGPASGAGSVCPVPVLPPVWPLGVRADAAHDVQTVSQLREVLAHESGLRDLPRITIQLPAASATEAIVIEYDGDVVLATSTSPSSLPPPARAESWLLRASLQGGCCVHGIRHASLAAAVEGLSSWLRVPDSRPPTRVPAAPAARRKQDGKATLCLENTVNLTALLAEKGVVEVVLDGASGDLLCFGADRSDLILRFDKVNTTAGMQEMLRFCFWRYGLQRVHVCRGHSKAAMLCSLLSALFAPGGTAAESEAPARDGDDAIGRVALPLRAGYVVLRASSAAMLSEEVEEMCALVLTQANFLSRAAYHRVISGVAHARTTLPTVLFFAPYLAPFGPLRLWAVESRRKGQGDGGAAETSADSTAGEPTEPEGDARVAQEAHKPLLTLYISRRDDAGDHETTSHSHARWRGRSVSVPRTGAAWVAEVYEVLRAEYALCSDRIAPATRSARLRGCPSLSEALELLLSERLSGRVDARNWSAYAVANELLGGSLEYRQRGGDGQLFLKVSSQASILVTTANVDSLPKPPLFGVSVSLRDAVCSQLLDEICPGLASLVVLAAHSVHTFRCCLQISGVPWLAPLRINSVAPLADGAARLRLAIVWSARLPRASSSDVSASTETGPPRLPPPPALVYEVSGHSLAELLLCVLEDYFGNTKDQLFGCFAAAIGGRVRNAAAASGFLERSLVKLAARRRFAEVRMQYDHDKQLLQVTGWLEANRSGVAAPPQLLAEKSIRWDDIPRVVFKLLRSLLGYQKRMRGLSAAECDSRASGMKAQVAAVLGCNPTVLDSRMDRTGNTTRRRVFLPLELFPVVERSPRAAASLSTFPSRRGFIVSGAGSSDSGLESRLLRRLLWWGCGDYTSNAEPTLLSQTTVTLGARSAVGPQRALLTPPAPLPGRHGAAAESRPKPAAKVSLLERVHGAIETALGEVGSVASGGAVEVNMSQTFGLELLYAAAGEARGCTGNAALSSASVELLREPWSATLWAPAQVLRAEASVLLRLACLHDPANSATTHAVVAALLADGCLPSLRCGPQVSRRDFCVLFFRRYFDWRVCELADVADMPVLSSLSSIVVCEEVTADRAARGQRGGAATQRRGSRAVLRLGQIVAESDASVRLAQVLAQASSDDDDAARAQLWDVCARRVKEVFGVSRLMAVEDVDTAMLRFMEEAGQDRA